MKKKILLISLAAVLALSFGLVGCEEPSGVELSLLMSDHNPPTNAMAKALRAYADAIEAGSNGTIEIEVRYQGTGLDEGDVFSEMQLDTSLYAAGHYVPEVSDGICYLQVMALPFMGWPDIDAIANPGFPPNPPPVWDPLNCQETAMMIYDMLCLNYTAEFQGDFPATTKYVANYMMPPVALSYYDVGLNISTPTELDNNIASMLCMESGVSTILGLLNVTGDVQDLVPIMSGVAAGADDGFAQHLEFCAYFGLLKYLKSHTTFEGGLLITPIGILWNTSKYNACVAQLGAAADTVMAAANAAWVAQALAGTAVDTATAQTYISSHGDQSVTAINATAIVDNGWAGNVSSYVTTWENGCDDPAKAEEIYQKALWWIANFDTIWPPAGP